MLKKKKIIKFLYFKNIIKKKLKFNINKSIVHNNENLLKLILFNKIFFYDKKKKKTCIMGISNKYINKKIKLSRFAISYINCNNFNQNFTKK